MLSYDFRGVWQRSRAPIALSDNSTPVVRTAAPLQKYDCYRVFQPAKRCLDITGACVGLLLLWPLFLIIAILIVLDSSGPVFHRRRVLARQPWSPAGSEPATFDAFKFRTMRADADEYLRQHPALWEEYQREFKLKDDPRVTRFGRWLRRTSLDELPQLFNILLGQMSLIGPRMICPEELPRYGENAPDLLSVTPGLTGLWQVSGRQTVGYEDRVRLDMIYIRRYSPGMDFVILLRTVWCVVHGTGAY